MKPIQLFCLSLIAGLPMTQMTMAAAGGDYTIQGSLRNMDILPEKVYLIFRPKAHRPDDSAFVTNGSFSFKGHIDGPCMVTITKEYYDATGKRITMGHAGQSISFFLEASPIKVVWPGEMTNPVVTGSRADLDYHKANYRIDKWGDTLRSMYKMAMETKNVTLLNTFFSPEKMKKMEMFTREDFPAFIRRYQASTINLFLLESLIELPATAGWVEKVDSLYQLLPETIRSSDPGLVLGNRLAAELKIAPGRKAADFTQGEANGQPLALSSLKGKYTLLRF